MFQSTPARDGAGDLGGMTWEQVRARVSIHARSRWSGRLAKMDKRLALIEFQSTPARDGAGDVGDLGLGLAHQVSIHARSRWSGRLGIRP